MSKKIINVHYEGKCPDCGLEQYGEKNEVDILCITCNSIKNIDPNSEYPELQKYIILSSKYNVEYSIAYRKLFNNYYGREK